MSKTAINSVTNANVYLNGASFLGRAAEVTLPTVKWKTATHQGLGPVGEIELPTSGYEKLEAKFKWASYDRQALRAGADPRTAVSLQVRASLDVFSAGGLSEQQSLVVTLSGLYKEQNYGTFKQHEAVQPEATMVVYYLKVEINKQLVVEIDVFANIYRAGEGDLLARYRNLIGG